MSDPSMRAKDGALAHEDGRWQSFYEDRARPCPFFVESPDENLVEWIDEGLIAPGRSLDVGCGNARNALFLSSRGFSVDAVDSSRSAISWAQERVAQASAQVQLIHRSVFDLDLPRATYDLVYDSGCFHHIAPHRRARYIALVVDALRPGGWFGLTCFRQEFGSGYSDEEVYERRSTGGGLGFTEERLRDLWSDSLHVRIVRTMHERSRSSDTFGKAFLWVLLARRP